MDVAKEIFARLGPEIVTVFLVLSLATFSLEGNLRGRLLKLLAGAAFLLSLLLGLIFAPPLH